MTCFFTTIVYSNNTHRFRTFWSDLWNSHIYLSYFAWLHPWFPTDGPPGQTLLRHSWLDQIYKQVSPGDISGLGGLRTHHPSISCWSWHLFAISMAYTACRFAVLYSKTWASGCLAVFNGLSHRLD